MAPVPTYSLTKRRTQILIAILFGLTATGCGPSEEQKARDALIQRIDSLVATTPTVGNMDSLKENIKTILKAHCNESESMSGIMCGDPGVDQKYHTLSPEILAKLSEFNKKIVSVLYDEDSKECRARDGSGALINFDRGENLCIGTFSSINIPKYAAEMLEEFPGKNPLIAPGRYDMAILAENIQADEDREAAASQKRLEAEQARIKREADEARRQYIEDPSICTGEYKQYYRDVCQKVFGSFPDVPGLPNPYRQ